MHYCKIVIKKKKKTHRSVAIATGGNYESNHHYHYCSVSVYCLNVILRNSTSSQIGGPIHIRSPAYMYIYPTCLYKQRVVMSHNSLPLGTCRELWLIRSPILTCTCICRSLRLLIKVSLSTVWSTWVYVNYNFTIPRYKNGINGGLKTPTCNTICFSIKSHRVCTNHSG